MLVDSEGRHVCCSKVADALGIGRDRNGVPRRVSAREELQHDEAEGEEVRAVKHLGVHGMERL